MIRDQQLQLQFMSVVFKSSLPEHLKQWLLTQPLRKQLQLNRWFLTNPTGSSNKITQMLQVLKHIQSVSIQFLSISGGFIISSIPSQLCMPLWLNLQEIQTYHNKIANIQNLTFIHCPNLKSLKLSMNFITSFKPLNKTNWSRLQDAYIFGNANKQKCVDQNTASSVTSNRIKTSQSMFAIFYEPDNDYTQRVQDISTFLAKLQAKNLRRIALTHSQRIQQCKICKVLQQRFRNIHLQNFRPEIDPDYYSDNCEPPQSEENYLDSDQYEFLNQKQLIKLENQQIPKKNANKYHCKR